MAVEIKFNGNPNLFLKDPDLSNIGKRILQQGAEVLLELGYEDFTFKKMALRIGTTEATVYRYFENKHRYLLYLLSWYWNIMQFIIESETRHLKTDREKIERIIELLLHQDMQVEIHALVPVSTLMQIAKNEATKAYSVKAVDDLNMQKLYGPYKELCRCIGDIFLSYAPKYAFSRNLASTLLEMSLHLPYFSIHLPNLTDINSYPGSDLHDRFLKNMVFNNLHDKLSKI